MKEKIPLNKKETITVAGKTLELDVYRVKTDDLLFNPFNTRVFDIINSSKELKNEKDILNSKLAQDLIYSSLKKDHKDDINIKLRKSLEINKQVKVFFMNDDFVLLSGNNRLSLIKSEREINKNFWPYVEVAIVPNIKSEDEIVLVELSLQNEFEIKKDYETMSKVMRTFERHEKGYTKEDIVKFVGLSNEKVVDEYIKTYLLYLDLLEFLKIPIRQDLYRYIPLFSNLHGFATSIPVKKDIYYSIFKKNFFKLIISSDVPVQKARDVIFPLYKNNKLSDEQKLEFVQFFSQILNRELGNEFNHIQEQMLRNENYSIVFKSLKKLRFDNIVKAKKIIEELKQWSKNIEEMLKINVFKSVNKKIDNINKLIDEVIKNKNYLSIDEKILVIESLSTVNFRIKKIIDDNDE